MCVPLKHPELSLLSAFHAHEALEYIRRLKRLLCCRSEEGALETDLLPPRVEHFADVKPECEVPSQSFAAALFDIYLSPSSPVVGARDKWALAARTLLLAPDASE